MCIRSRNLKLFVYGLLWHHCYDEVFIYWSLASAFLNWQIFKVWNIKSFVCLMQQHERAHFYDEMPIPWKISLCNKYSLHNIHSVISTTTFGFLRLTVNIFVDFWSLFIFTIRSMWFCLFYKIFVIDLIRPFYYHISLTLSVWYLSRIYLWVFSTGFCGEILIFPVFGNWSGAENICPKLIKKKKYLRSKLD